jgi:hypothetical protein
MSQKKERFMTVKLPADIDDALRQVADIQTRTLSAQILHYIKQGLQKDAASTQGEKK